MEMDGFLWMLDVVEKLDEWEVNEEKCKHSEREVQKKQGGWYL